MTIEHWLAFVAASAVLLVLPGPTILTVISYSLAHGRRARVPLVAAVALGDATALTMSTLGLGALLATSAFWAANTGSGLNIVFQAATATGTMPLLVNVTYVQKRGGAGGGS